LSIARLGGLSRRLGGLATGLRIAAPSGGVGGGLGTIGSGILFPSNGDGGVSNVRFQFTGSAMPDIVPLTVMLKVMPIQQAGYRTNFFHGQNDGGFTADATYFGCHPYPNPPPNGTNANWEISMFGTDDTTDENGNSTAVVHGTVGGGEVWYSQASQAQNIATVGNVDYYWNLRAGTNRIINHQTTSGFPLTNNATPALVFGDAPWSPNNERLSGVLRGLQIYQGLPSLAHLAALDLREDDAAVLAYCSANGLTPWYVNMNLTPSDIADKSGAGHHPAWVSGDHGTLWTP